jgi:hypothetical protein
MSSTKRGKGGRVHKVSQALADRPFVGRSSKEGAAHARQIPGLVIGPYAPTVDPSDPASLRAALANEPFRHLISDELIEKLCREGHGAALFPGRYPTWRYGIDPIT